MSIQLLALTEAHLEEIIRLAEAKAADGTQRKVQSPSDLTKTNPHYQVWQHLLSKIDALSPAARMELMALAWMGQGRVGKDLGRWAELLNQAACQVDQDLSFQIAMHGQLPKCLRKGIEMLG